MGISGAQHLWLIAWLTLPYSGMHAIIMHLCTNFFFYDSTQLATKVRLVHDNIYLSVIIHVLLLHIWLLFGIYDQLDQLLHLP